MSDTRGAYQAGTVRRVWAQGDCVAYDVEDPVQACRMYRRDMAHAQIGISTHNPDALRVREYAAELEAVRAEIGRLRGALEQISRLATSGPNHAWPKVDYAAELATRALAEQPAGKESETDGR